MAVATLSSTRRLPPLAPGGLPGLGHALALQRQPVQFLLRTRRELGELFALQLAGARAAFFSGPAANEAFFRAPDSQLSAREAYRFTIPIFGPDVAYAAPEERMSEQLAMILPALNETRLRTYAGFIRDEVESFVAGWADEGTIDLLQTTNALTVFIASRCLVGREFRQHLTEEFSRLYHDLEGGINLLGFFLPNLPLPAFQRRDRARERLAELIAGIIARRREGSAGEDFLQTLMTARYEDGSTLSDDQITGLLLTLIFAGQHTSAVQAAWAGVELLRHPAYLQRVLHEQEEVLPAGRDLGFDALREMALLERGIQESERLHPPLILLMRKVLEEFHYKQYRVPAGWLAMASPAVSHRLPEAFPDPDSYDPDRFLQRPPRFGIVSFGGGKHGCIGMQFAYLQVKTIWSVLLRRFELRLVDTRVQPNYATFVVGPKPPCRVAYRRRNELTNMNGYRPR